MRWIVPTVWKGDTCVILAGGPSLKGFDTGILRKSGIRTIAINDSWQIAPWADVCYFGDASWWAMQQAMNPRTADRTLSFHDMIYKAFWVTIAHTMFIDHPQVRCLWSTGQRGLEDNPTALRTGSNSGYASINLAYHYGAHRIILLGYDMKCQGSVTHWHNGPREPAGVFGVALQTLLPHFVTLVEPLEKAGVEVVNATPDSALTCWPSKSIEEALEEHEEESKVWRLPAD
jgi:hypothetical protein